MNELQFPIGKYTPNKIPTEQQLSDWLNSIASFPEKVAELTKDASIEAINWQYRPKGWTVKQVIHHCADSHMNSIIRFKLALTEEAPTIRPYFEDRWAELHDSLDDDLHDVLQLLQGLHNKWVVLLKSISAEQMQREYVHPEHGQRFNIAETIGSYAWHCEHHLAHIKNGLSSNGKFTN
ncbi:MAG: bacillithiol transferase BstA [Crocinitomicaceae bacterium]